MTKPRRGRALDRIGDLARQVLAVIEENLVGVSNAEQGERVYADLLASALRQLFLEFAASRGLLAAQQIPRPALFSSLGGLEEETLGRVYEVLMGFEVSRDASGSFVVVKGRARRRTGSHYTPRDLTDPLVARTLEPLIRSLGDSPRSGALLDLLVCDPAVGSGVFLLSACRYLANHLLDAFRREGAVDFIEKTYGDVLSYCRRRVAECCLYGVDKNETAVEISRLSLWLLAMDPRLPLTFVDHAIRHGDSLVGLNLDQIKAFHWKPERAGQHASALLTEVLEADPISDKATLCGDLIVGAFFAGITARERETERTRRLSLVTEWLNAERAGDTKRASAVFDRLNDLARVIAKTPRPFHWKLQLLRDKGRACPDAFVGNPPFVGGRRIRGELGDVYTEWLGETGGGSLNADMSARFFRQCAALLGDHGVVGLLATNTIGQGDTRDTGLGPMVEQDGFFIYDVVSNQPWPGDAVVTISTVCLAKGKLLRSGLSARLDGVIVPFINSRLRPAKEFPKPYPLPSNLHFSFQGCVLAPNAGFVISTQERDKLVSRDPRNASLIRPFLGGEEVNTKPDQGFDRYAIFFDAMPLSACEAFPDLLAVVEARAKPVRKKAARSAHRRYWWHYADKRPALFAALKPLSRCLVTARVTKHLCFSFQPTDRVFNEKLYVFPLDKNSAFAVLQSRVHSVWAWLLSSTLAMTLNYTATDCFDTFPFPSPDPRTVFPRLEEIGALLYEKRATWMKQKQVGLTKAYNALLDPANKEPEILELRACHEELDRRVLEAYGWQDLPVPLYCAASTKEQELERQFNEEIMMRLFRLNAQRAGQRSG